MVWNFDNSYLRLPPIFYQKVMPQQASAPRLVLFNEKLAASLGIDEASAEAYTGNRLPVGSEPIAQAYAGHQFGHFNILGDGRAILLGEHITPANERYDIQLKGSGRTAYSRGGDGLATLPAMLREYVISEAMAGLGISTTRSLAVTLTGDPVFRETEMQGAVLTRVAASHLRVGTFQYAATQGSEAVRALADYAIARHYPGLGYLEFLSAVIERQAKLIAAWVSVGFIHGVMNTDNMTISGETIDYGPCAFMDVYDPKTVFSSIDYHGRYAYGQQIGIGLWNLTRLAECLLPLIHDDEGVAIALAEQALERYGEHFQLSWLGKMRLKLGLMNEEEEDVTLVQGFLDLLQSDKRDYTNSFRDLNVIASEAKQSKNEGVDCHGASALRNDAHPWYALYSARLSRNSVSLEEAVTVMNAHNPIIIARNYKVEEALAAANYGDYSFVIRLVEAIQKPFEENEAFADLREPGNAEGYMTFCGT